MLPSSERLLQEIRRHDGVKTRELAKTFEVGDGEFDGLVALLSDFQERGQLVRIPEHGWQFPEKTSFRIGILKMSRKGHAFVELIRPEHAGDIFIPPRATGSSFNGDLVLVELAARGRKRPIPKAKKKTAAGPASRLRDGRIVDVVRRTKSLIPGQYKTARPSRKKARSAEKNSDPGFVTPFKFPGVQIFIPPGSEGGASDGQKVLARLVDGKGYGVYPSGEVVHAPGRDDAPAGSMESDFQQIAAEFGFPVAHAASALEEAARAPEPGAIPPDPIREDLRSLLTLTIDPEDAQDYDDAVSLEAGPDGGHRLGVHIADVAFYTPPGSALDRSARERSTSIYLPGRVVPMLPERISNNLASLRPQVDRLAKSVFMDFDAEGRMIGRRVCRSLIRTARRFTYEEALGILENPGRPGEAPFDGVLQEMGRLRDRLHRQRLDRGALELNIPRIRLSIGKDGEVASIGQDRRDPAHHLIEEFMLAANEAVAAYMQERGLPLVYRVHPEPDEERLEEFFFFLQKMEVGTGRKPGSKDLQKIAARVDGMPYASIIHLSLLRSLPHAEYSPEAGLHFALATSCYCHFTSPIRRYPDLLVHQVLDEHWDRKLQQKTRLEEWRQLLPRLASEASLAERRAEDAEREMIRLRLIRHLKERVGEEMPGMVTSVHPFGFFVQVEGLLIDGLVHISTLNDDRYDYEPENFCLKGMKRRRTIRLGQRLKVILAELDPDLREIRFQLSGRTNDRD